ncbi:NACHT domain-containing protein [Streptomyces sodiiphilus]|uniref:NACHT domain-containing protein n=1 Tax=Streptomyces sodiiphilus TaxID=226217 RepID=A0ABN2NS55_9ACTN
MEPSAAAVRLASGAVASLVKKLFVVEGPGAGLVDRPVRMSGRLSFTGERRTLGEKQLRALAAELVDRAAEADGPHEAPSAQTRRELADALARALHGLGDLDMDDAQAVALGPEKLAARLPSPPTGLSADAEARYDALLHTACLHILHFFTQRSTFVPRTLTEQTRAINGLVAVTDLLCERIPSQSAEDARFEQRYAEHIVRKHGELTIYGLDLQHAREWRLDSAYIALEATGEDDSVPVPAERALAGRDKVLLRGGAGSGKTTLVQWLAVTTARRDYDPHLAHLIGRVPFVLPLRRVFRDDRLPTPDEFLHAVRSAVAGSQPTGWADRVMHAGRAFLLVDGIDEIPADRREQARRWMRELMADFPDNLWLVTARPSAVREDWLAGEGFTELALAPMSHHDISLFVRRWHEAAGAGPELGEALRSAIRTDTDLGRLAVNPLMCGLLCALHRERHGFLPSGRKDLYEAALGMLLERRDVERGVPATEDLRLSKETQIQLLQKLAHWLIRNDAAEMERSDALRQLERALEYMAHVPATPEQVLAHLLVRSGLLREPAEGRVDFVHRTFQDYLGAKAAVEEGDFPLLLNNAGKDQWEDVIRMAVALGRPAERARILGGLVEGMGPDEITSLRELSPRSLVQPERLRQVLLAATCLEHATEIAPGIRQQVLDLAALLVPPRSRLWSTMLAEVGGPMVLKLLPGPEGLREDEADNVVVTATRIGTDAALPVLARFRHHPALKVRSQLAWSWHRFDTAQYAEEIVRHLDETDLYFCAHHTGHLKALRAMGGRARIQLLGTFHAQELIDHLPPERLTHLWLPEDETTVTGEEWRAAFPHLKMSTHPRRQRAKQPAGRPSHGPLPLPRQRPELPGLEDS